ncbi:alpha/beta hydrolase [Caballeronia sp. LjRoot34]|uniref:alpha/beta fold hydrolase n=1 Tax=Caballeronia sp. LjRoot34 TaxID=3342325 RepID=UPI003ECF151C
MREETFDFEGIPVTYYHGGKGDPVLLIHGSGPGASSVGNWRGVLGPLSERYEVFAMDLIGFGKSGRKLAAPYFDYPLWVRQAEAMLSEIGGDAVGVVGHSLSASIALTLASSNPRISAVITTGAMGAPFVPNETTHRSWTCPTSRAELATALRGLVFDASVIDDAYLDAREPVVFAPGYASYFNQMFEGDHAKYIEAATLSAETLAAVKCPVVLLHGREDKGFPPDNSIWLARQLLHSDLILLGECSHSVAFERSATFLATARELFARSSA